MVRYFFVLKNFRNGGKKRRERCLGLILDSGLSFEKHLKKIIKAKKNIGIIKHLSKFLPLKTLDV